MILKARQAFSVTTFLCILIFISYFPAVLTTEEDEEIPVVEGNGGNLNILTEGDVIVLTSDNFDLITASRDLLLVEFYAPWCGHCKSLEPEYAKAATELKKSDPPIEIAKIDATKAEAIARRYDVKGFPTILLLKKGEVIETYSEDRSAMAIVQFMKKRSDPDYKPPPKRVIELTKDTFKEIVESSKIILVQFYSQDCGICKDLAPRYELAAQELYELHPSIPLARIDGKVYKEIADEYDAKDWPVLKIFRGGRVYDYEGPKETEGMVPYLIEQSKLPSTEVQNNQQLLNNLSNDTISIVGFFNDDSSPLYEEYIAAANVLRRLFKFSHSFEEDVFTHFKEKANSIVIFKPSIFQSKYEESRYRITEEKSTDAEIKKFIQEHQVPLVGQRTKKNFELYSQRPLCVIYCDVNFSHDYRVASQIIRKQILEVAKEFKDVTFALSNDEEFQDELLAFGLEDSSEEINAALFLSGTKRFSLNPTEEFDNDVLRSFVKDVLSGKLKPYLKSQPVPKNNNGPVKKIVANNYDELVLNSPESVLLEFYAPWCGHCKALNPIFKKLGKKYASNEDITIAQMDATANDIDELFTITGYPSIYLLKAGDKSNPVTFEGSRTLEGLSSFIDSNLDSSKSEKKDEL